MAMDGKIGVRGRLGPQIIFANLVSPLSCSFSRMKPTLLPEALPVGVGETIDLILSLLGPFGNRRARGWGQERKSDSSFV